ncbi:hypothetical protein [Amycolatopsis lexingtonensis]|uniref:hypothetical protein n=1 Tax=Amycolatopsis lexingtonensis TaxID=218822 RepID=UPI003F6FF018
MADDRNDHCDSLPVPRWPTADDLAVVEHPYFVFLSRVLHGLRHLAASDEAVASTT